MEPNGTYYTPSGDENVAPTSPLDELAQFKAVVEREFHQLRQLLHNADQEILRLRHQLEEVSRRSSAGAFKLSKPPPFTGDAKGQTATQWLGSLEHYFKLVDFTPDQCLHYVGNFLSGGAWGWYSRENAIESFPTWEAFRSMFLRHYQPVNAGVTGRDRLYHMRQGKDSVGKYRDEFLNIMSEIADLGDQEALNLFKQGLNEHIRRNILLLQPDTLRTAMEAAAMVEESHPRRENVRGRVVQRPYVPSHPYRSRGQYGPTPMELGARESPYSRSESKREEDKPPQRVRFDSRPTNMGRPSPRGRWGSYPNRQGFGRPSGSNPRSLRIAEVPNGISATNPKSASPAKSSQGPYEYDPWSITSDDEDDKYKDDESASQSSQEDGNSTH